MNEASIIFQRGKPHPAITTQAQADGYRKALEMWEGPSATQRLYDELNALADLGRTPPKPPIPEKRR
jgi:hypothetical protein